MVHSTCGCTCGWQVKLCNSSLTRAIRYTNAQFTLLSKLSHFDDTLVQMSHSNSLIFGRPLQVTVRPMLLDCCLALSVTLVFCGQTVRWIKMPLRTEVAGDIVLDEDPAPPT